MATPEEQGVPSFVTGFGLGLLAGAAGFVLFGTKKGSIIRRDLQKAFAQAYEQEIASGAVTGEAISLRDFLTTAFTNVKAELELESTTAAKQTKVSSRHSAKTRGHKSKSTETKTKFKNV